MIKTGVGELTITQEKVEMNGIGERALKKNFFCLTILMVCAGLSYRGDDT